jgi:hypothetical protein
MCIVLHALSKVFRVLQHKKLYDRKHEDLFVLEPAHKCVIKCFQNAFGIDKNIFLTLCYPHNNDFQ